jgi:hypothetical protein
MPTTVVAPAITSELNSQCPKSHVPWMSVVLRSASKFSNVTCVGNGLADRSGIPFGVSAILMTHNTGYSVAMVNGIRIA